MTLWDLDAKNMQTNTFEAKQYFRKMKKAPNITRFQEGQKITFFTGYNDDIRAIGTIKAISGGDIYVYNDCYWYPIQDDDRRKIAIT